MKILKMKMSDPIFGAGEARTAVATFPVKPAALACTAELWLTRDGTTKAATSGKIPFTSTGVDQSVSCPVTMPVEEGFAYQVRLDVQANGILISAYVADEDVIIPWVGPPIITW